MAIIYDNKGVSTKVEARADTYHEKVFLNNPDKTGGFWVTKKTLEEILKDLDSGNCDLIGGY